MSTSVDRTRIPSGESVELVVSWNGQVTTSPDFSALEYNFEILSTQQQNSFSFNNGNTASLTSWVVRLLPKQTGKVLIPSLNYQGAVSDAIMVEVTQPQVYLETSLDKQQPYVQEQVLLSYRIFSRVRLQEYVNDELIIPGATVLKVGETRSQQTIDGVPHLIIELKYAIFPQNSGQLEIPALRFNTIIEDSRDPFPRGFFSRSGKQVRLTGERKTLSVQPRPAGSGNGDWLPSTGVSLSERWSRPLNELRAGEPVTRIITLTAQQAAGVQLPPLNLPAVEGIKLYPDQPQLNDSVTDSGVLGERKEIMAIVPSQAGEIAFPPVTVSWWDTKNQQLKETVLAGKTIQVLPAEGLSEQTSGQASTTTPANQQTDTATNQPSDGPQYWILLLIASNFSLLLMVIYLLLTRNKTAPTQAEPKNLTLSAPSEPELFNAISQAAKANDSRKFRSAIITWGRAFYSRPELNTLNAIAAACDDKPLQAKLIQAFTQLDQSLFASDLANNRDHSVDLADTLALIQALRKQQPATKKQKNAGLKPLYGN